LIAEVMDKVGKDGVITVEESKGLEFERNTWKVCSSTAVNFFLLHHRYRQDGIDHPRSLYLIYDKKISAAQDIVPVLEKLVSTANAIWSSLPRY
jgi:chaperonin GroEL